VQGPRELAKLCSARCELALSAGLPVPFAPAAAHRPAAAVLAGHRRRGAMARGGRSGARARGDGEQPQAAEPGRRRSCAPRRGGDPIRLSVDRRQWASRRRGPGRRAPRRRQASRRRKAPGSRPPSSRGSTRARHYSRRRKAPRADPRRRAPPPPSSLAGAGAAAVPRHAPRGGRARPWRSRGRGGGRACGAASRTRGHGGPERAAAGLRAAAGWSGGGCGPWPARHGRHGRRGEGAGAPMAEARGGSRAAGLQRPGGAGAKEMKGWGRRPRWIGRGCPRRQSMVVRDILDLDDTLE